ncbi:hypothetical protein ACJX0J_037019, partial [Zea mays]
ATVLIWHTDLFLLAAAFIDAFLVFQQDNPIGIGNIGIGNAINFLMELDEIRKNMKNFNLNFFRKNGLKWLIVEGIGAYYRARTPEFLLEVEEQAFLWFIIY